MTKNLLLSALVFALVVANIAQFFGPGPAQGQDKAEQKVPSKKDQEIADRYHEWFYRNLEITWANSKWLGIYTLQNPNDVWIHQEIITEVKPDYIIEAGTAAGGSALIWAMVLQQVNPTAKVITLDIEDHTENARKLPVWQERIEFIKGSSTDPKIVAELAKRVQGRKVLVILDSDHSKNHVLDELKAYSPMVSVGSYLIVQDTNINGHPVLKEFGPGPYEAVEEFLATNKQFESDRSRERFLFTMHPNGYLKRMNSTDDLAAAQPSDAEVKAELKKLQGTWTVAKQINDGTETPAEEAKKIKVIFDGEGKWKVDVEGTTFVEGTLTLDPSKKPKTIDYKITKGDEKDKVLMAIYELEGDSFKHCGAFKGARPTAFASAPGSGHTFTVFQRQK
jgi:uncharacterized protein (TIGR03067 family)